MIEIRKTIAIKAHAGHIEAVREKDGSLTLKDLTTGNTYECQADLAQALARALTELYRGTNERNSRNV